MNATVRVYGKWWNLFTVCITHAKRRIRHSHTYVCGLKDQETFCPYNCAHFHVTSSGVDGIVSGGVTPVFQLTRVYSSSTLSSWCSDLNILCVGIQLLRFFTFCWCNKLFTCMYCIRLHILLLLYPIHLA